MVHMYESYSMIQAERSQKEYRERFKIWKEHKDFIESKDSENLGFAMNLNQFAHLSPREWYGTDFLLADAPQVRDPYWTVRTRRVLNMNFRYHLVMTLALPKIILHQIALIGEKLARFYQ